MFVSVHRTYKLFLTLSVRWYDVMTWHWIFTETFLNFLFVAWIWNRNTQDIWDLKFSNGRSFFVLVNFYCYSLLLVLLQITINSLYIGGKWRSRVLLRLLYVSAIKNERTLKAGRICCFYTIYMWCSENDLWPQVGVKG